MMKRLIWALLITFLFSCGTKKNNQNEKNLPKSIGGTSKVLVVANEDLWNSSIGDALKEVLNTPYPGLISPEPYFSVNRVAPSKFNDLYNKQRILLIPIILNEASRFTKTLSNTTIEKVESDGVFLLEKKDVWATNQYVFFLVSPTRAQFLESLAQRKANLLNLLDDRIVTGLLPEMKIKNRSRNIEEYLQEKGIEITIPEKFELAQDSAGLLWIRSYRKDADLNLVIASRPYLSEDQFLDSGLISWRDEVCGKIFVDPDDTASYMITETYVSPKIKSITSDNGYTKKMNGLWRINNYRLGGGTFVSYSFLDKEETYQYYAEGFVFAPEKEKIPYLRKLDATLKSIAFKSLENK